MGKFSILLSIVLLNFFAVLGQDERSQKSAIRQGLPTQPRQTSPSPSLPSYNTRPNSYESQKKYDIRRSEDRSRIQPRPIYTTPYPYYSPFSPMWGGPWSRWGAPLNYWYYDDIFIPNNWGYQAPARVYYHEGRRADTVVSLKKKVRLGLSVGTWDMAGGWITVGRETFFKAQLLSKITSDRSRFYSNPEVNFLNASTIWKDERLSDIQKGWVLYLGVGRELRNLGVNASIGFGRDERNFQFMDEYYELSPNGRYSFRNYSDGFVTISLGLTHDFKFLSVSADYDPIRNTILLGTGFNF